MANQAGGYGKVVMGAKMVKRPRRLAKIEKNGKMVNPACGLKPFIGRLGDFAALPFSHYSAPTGFTSLSVSPYPLFADRRLG